MTPPAHPTNGATFRVDGRAYRCILVLSTVPASLALYECEACATVTTDPCRHGKLCSEQPSRRPRGTGVAVTIPLPGRPR